MATFSFVSAILEVGKKCFDYCNVARSVRSCRRLPIQWQDVGWNSLISCLTASDHINLGFGILQVGKQEVFAIGEVLFVGAKDAILLRCVEL
jgi:hypothetical protein